MNDRPSGALQFLGFCAKLAEVDLSIIPELRALWGYYRDRRPDMYGPLLDAVAQPSHRVGV